MNAFLTLATQVIAYSDDTVTANPLLKHVDWRRVVQNIAVRDPHSEPQTIPAGSSKTIFNGTRSTSIDGTTAWTLSLLDASTYRMTSPSGTAPVLRTDRGLTLNGRTVTVTVLANQIVTFSSSSAGDFAAVVVGDTVFIPGTTTGDASGPFNLLNEGLWVVLAKDGGNQVLQLSRPDGVDFTALTEAPVMSSNTQFQAYSAAGVQVGDVVDLSGTFPTTLQRSFTVTMVAPKYFEFVSADPLPTVPALGAGATAVIFYTNGKRYVRVEADQEAVVQLNGDTGTTNRLSPWAPGDRSKMAQYEKVGPCWSLTIVNRSNQTLNANVITVE